MFVRWRRRELKGHPAWRWYDPGASLAAVVVESERRDGKVRQRFVGRVGTVRERDLATSARERELLRFWRQARWRLDRMGLSPEQRARVEDQLARRIPKPPAEAVEREDRAGREALARLARSGHPGAVAIPG